MVIVRKFLIFKKGHINSFWGLYDPFITKNERCNLCPIKKIVRYCGNKEISLIILSNQNDIIALFSFYKFKITQKLSTLWVKAFIIIEHNLTTNGN